MDTEAAKNPFDQLKIAVKGYGLSENHPHGCAAGAGERSKLAVAAANFAQLPPYVLELEILFLYSVALVRNY